MLELIEHLSLTELDAAVTQVFGVLQPLYVFVTTPNIEYNPILSKAFEDRRREGEFRHPGHQFEWTREEFKVWCESVCSKFVYRADIFGIGQVVGSPDAESVGFASNAVLFCRVDKVIKEFSAPSNGCFVAALEVDAQTNYIPGFTPQPTPEVSEDEVPLSSDEE
jgi:hypothetical protein